MKKEVSVLTLDWDNHELTDKFVDSVRKHWKGDYELLVLDNGSASMYKNDKVDKIVRSTRNRGFGGGFNHLREHANGKHLCLMNNDALFVETPDWNYKRGLMFCTAENVRSEVNEAIMPAHGIRRLEKFSQKLPSGVGMYLSADLFDAVHGFSPEFKIASGEDSDLCFKVWEHGDEVFVNDRVWVKHIGKATARLLPNWQDLWKKNGAKFKKKWQKYF